MSILRTLAKLAIVVLVLAMLALVVPAEIAAQYACDLDLAATSPCRVGGTEMGGALRVISANSWMAILAAEAAIAVVLLRLFVGLVRRLGGNG